jgi:hypothetical protein
MKDGTTKLPTFDVYIYQFRILNVPIQPRTDETPDLVTDPARRNSLLLQALGISPDGTIMPEFDLTVKKPECRLKHVKLFKSGTGAPMYHFLLDAKRQRRDRYPQHFVGPLKEDSHWTGPIEIDTSASQYLCNKMKGDDNERTAQGI